MPLLFRNSYPYWYYKKISLLDAGGASLGPTRAIWPLKPGFDYWIRGFLISYPHYENVGHPDDVSPPLYMSLMQYERNRELTEIPIPTELMAVPGGKQPPPPGHAQHDRQLLNGWIRFNYIISNADVLNVRFEGHTAAHPEYVRVAVIGHNVKAGSYV